MNNSKSMILNRVNLPRLIEFQALLDVAILAHAVPLHRPTASARAAHGLRRSGLARGGGERRMRRRAA